MSYKRKILYSQFLLVLGLITLLLPAIGYLTSFVLGETLTHFYPVKRGLDLTILGICIVLLLVNGSLIMFIFHRVMKPVQQIIQAIKSYREGKEDCLPEIFLKEGAIEFTQLASTINSLNDQIRKQITFLTRQREETEEILESIGEGIVAADPSARITFANQSACKILGLLKEEIIGKTLEGIYRSNLKNWAFAKNGSENLHSGERTFLGNSIDKANCKRGSRQSKTDSLGIDTSQKEIYKKCHELIVHALQTAETTRHTWIVREKGTFYYDLIAAPLAHKNGVLLVLQDKTSDHRIVELGKDFIANASHELKTPITIIRGFAETLQDLPDLSKEMLHEITQRIVKTCGRLDKLVRSLLTLTDIEQVSEKDFGKVDLISVLAGCVDMLLAVHPTAKVRLESDALSAEVLADAPLIELAVMNILENAVRYSQDTAEIKVVVKSAKDAVQIDFHDQGIGISENDLLQIFERFYTVDKARTRKKGGAGLGLSIVKTVLEKHKGKVTVSSQLGKGSLFTFIIPKR